MLLSCILLHSRRLQQQQPGLSSPVVSSGCCHMLWHPAGRSVLSLTQGLGCLEDLICCGYAGTKYDFAVDSHHAV